MAANLAPGAAALIGVATGAITPGTNKRSTQAQANRACQAIIKSINKYGGAGAAVTQAEFDVIFANIIMTIANIGTSSATDFNFQVTYLVTNNAAAGSPVNYNFKDTVTDKIIKHANSVRRFHRRFADIVYDIAKRDNRVFDIGVMHGVPKRFGYIGFDTADNISGRKIDDMEAIALDNAKAVGLFSSPEEEDLTSTSSQFNRGRRTVKTSRNRTIF